MRTIEIGPEFLQYCQDFYADFDFMLMLVQICVVMFVCVIILKLVVPDVLNTNLTFYMSFLTLMLYICNMGKGTFEHGYLKLSDETKVQLMLSTKSAIVVFLVLYYTEGNALLWVINLDIPQAHNLFVNKMNILYALGGAKISLEVEFTYAMMAIMSGGITFLVMKNAIGFAYYFFSMLRVQEMYASQPDFFD
jgi:hypothetical protein